MKQGILRGFGTPYLTGALPPEDMDDDVVTLCIASDNPEASAIRLSIQYAKRRFGYRQIDIAKLCGWDTDNHLSSYHKGRADMPAKHYRRFAQVTGCNLLEQVQRRSELAVSLSGRNTPNDRERLALAMMMRNAA